MALLVETVFNFRGRRLERSRTTMSPSLGRKSLHAPPMLSRDDGPVMRLRGWYRKFFPELAANQAFEER